MLNKVLFAVLVTAVAIAGIVSVNEYNQFKSDQRNTQAIAEQAKIEQELAHQNTITKLQSEVDSYKANCLLGIEAYNLLDETDQETIAKPVCGLEILQ